MNISLHGHHFELGEALKTHVNERLESISEKYFGRTVNVTVTLTKETKTLFKSQISMTIGKDIQVQSTASEHDVYASFDMAAERVAKQLRRYKRKLKDHHEQMESAEHFRAPEYTIGIPLNDDHVDHLTDAEIDAQDEPMIIAEMTTNIQTMSVSDAVMRLNLSGNNAMMFRNSKNGGLNMVYRRQDGNIGWVDPNQTAIKQSDVA
jgi:ribosomal subunit interface protein